MFHDGRVYTTGGADIQSAGVNSGASIPFHKSSFVSIIVRQLLNNSIVSTSSQARQIAQGLDCGRRRRRRRRRMMKRREG